MVLEEADQSSPPEWLGESELKPFRYPFATFVDGQEVPGEPKNMMGP